MHLMFNFNRIFTSADTEYKLTAYIKENKEPSGLIGHLSNCCVAFAMYINVHYNYKATEIILNIPVL